MGGNDWERREERGEKREERSRRRRRRRVGTKEVLEKNSHIRIEPTCNHKNRSGSNEAIITELERGRQYIRRKENEKKSIK